MLPKKCITYAIFTLFISFTSATLKGNYQSSRITFSLNSIVHLAAESAPRLINTFPEQIVEQGARVSLKCGASGNPLPQITWTLDNQSIKEVYHVRIGDYVSDVYTVNSYINISSVKLSDGGLYTCKATNSAGNSQYKSRINIIGPPFIKSMPNITALSNHNIQLLCPYSGYPIKSISWMRSEYDSHFFVIIIYLMRLFNHFHHLLATSLEIIHYHLLDTILEIILIIYLI